MRYAKGKGLSAASGGRLSAFSTSFVQVPKSVVLIGLLYAIIAASVVYLLGGGLWAMLFAFMLGGACAAKIAALVRTDILQGLHIPGAPTDPLSEESSLALSHEREGGKADKAFLALSGNQRADDTADV